MEMHASLRSMLGVRRTNLTRMGIPAGILSLTFAMTATAAPQPASPSARSAVNPEMLVYVGSYAAKTQDSIHWYGFDLESGVLTRKGAYAGVTNPSFLAIDPSGRRLYAVGEIDDYQGVASGVVSAFEIAAATGALRQLNQQASGGSGPCHLIVDDSNRTLLVANYGSGSVASIHLESDGCLGPLVSQIQHSGSGANPRRQEAPHAHAIYLDAAQRFAVAADLGLDQLISYPFHAASGRLESDEPGASPAAAGNRAVAQGQASPAVSIFRSQPGDGPRHFAFHPDGRRAYVINELHSTITALTYSPEEGTLQAIGTVSTLPDDFSGSNSTAEIEVDRTGRFVYGSNRGHNSIAIFRVLDTAPGLEPIRFEPTRGQTPRNFAIDPTGRFLIAANQDSHTLEVFRIDADTGLLTYTGHSTPVSQPVCIVFLERTP